jgi:hypothetical protein
VPANKGFGYSTLSGTVLAAYAAAPRARAERIMNLRCMEEKAAETFEPLMGT